jgi:hypothetical protein
VKNDRFTVTTSVPLTDRERHRLYVACCNSKAKFTQEQYEVFQEWVEMQRGVAATLEDILAGKLNVRLPKAPLLIYNVPYMFEDSKEEKR